MTGPGRRGSDPPRDLLPDLFELAGERSRAARQAPEVQRAEPEVPGESPETALSISMLARTAKEVVEGAFFPLWIRGEVCDFKRHRSGNWYFSLRDDTALLKCVLWARDQFRVAAPPDDGMQVVAFGRLSVYPARSEMQFSVIKLEAVGDGAWRQALRAAARRLKAEGLLAQDRKRALPKFPKRLAVVTSLDGAALRDIISVVRRRCPIVEVVVIGARVQGEGAPDELIAAIDRVGRWGDADVLIIGRGGGSREDLSAFNDERVARALAACPIPTISAVGHEVDISLTDLVADVRAPTPSAAAETAVPVLADLHAELHAARAALRGGLARRVTLARRDLTLHTRRLANAATRATDRRRARWERAAGRLHALSPLAVLGRGYAVARREPDGRTLTDASAFERGQRFRLVLRDGEVHARAEEIVPGTPEGVDASRGKP